MAYDTKGDALRAGEVRVTIHMNKKIKSLKNLSLKRRSLRKKGEKVVFTNGCFDIIHFGHIAYLRKAKSFGDVLIVGLNRDSSVRRIKGRTRPIVPERDRAEVLSELTCIDYVVFFSEDTPYKVIKTLEPDILVKGSDWPLDKIVGRDILRSYGGRVKRVKLIKGKSTSNIIKRIKQI